MSTSLETVYKVSLEGYWIDVSKRIWKTKNNELYHIAPSGRAVKYIENMEIEDNSRSSQFSDLTFSFGPTQNDNVVENVDEAPPSKKTKVI